MTIDEWWTKELEIRGMVVLLELLQRRGIELDLWTEGGQVHVWMFDGPMRRSSERFSSPDPFDLWALLSGALDSLIGDEDDGEREGSDSEGGDAGEGSVEAGEGGDGGPVGGVVGGVEAVG